MEAIRQGENDCRRQQRGGPGHGVGRAGWPRQLGIDGNGRGGSSQYDGNYNNGYHQPSHYKRNYNERRNVCSRDAGADYGREVCNNDRSVADEDAGVVSGFESAGFHAMGTEVEVLAAPALPEGAVRRVRRLFEEMEARFSRFRPTSELSQLNASAGRPFPVTAIFEELLSEAVAAAAESGGMFDPMVLPAVEAAGYRVTIDSVRGSVQLQTLPPPTETYEAIEITDGLVRLPPGGGIDLGGFAKGWTVDRAAGVMEGLDDWVVNAGGDLLARGGGPDGDGWLIGVEDPFAPGVELAVLRVRDAAVATSSTRRRRWQTQDGEAHHLIDPRTGLPSQTDLAAVTVLAESVSKAEVAAKVLLLLGRQEARRYSEENGIQALIVGETGAVEYLGGMEGCVV